MDDSVALRQIVAMKIVMIGNDQIDVAIGGDFCGGNGGYAAIDSDDQIRATIADFCDGIGVESVTFFQAMRNIVLSHPAKGADRVPQNTGGGDPVDVVITVDDDLLSIGNRFGDSLRGTVQAGEQRWLVQTIEAGPKKILTVLRLVYSTVDQHLTDQRRKLQPARQFRGKWTCVGDVPAAGS